MFEYEVPLEAKQAFRLLKAVTKVDPSAYLQISYTIGYSNTRVTDLIDEYIQEVRGHRISQKEP